MQMPGQFQSGDASSDGYRSLISNTYAIRVKISSSAGDGEIEMVVLPIDSWGKTFLKECEPSILRNLGTPVKVPRPTGDITGD